MNPFFRVHLRMSTTIFVFYFNLDLCYRFEKYIGGHYLGEIFRHLLLDLTETGVIFNGNVSNQLKIKDSIKSEHLSSIEGYFISILLFYFYYKFIDLY